MNGIDAGRLIAFAADVTATPGSSGEAAEYARLVERYLSEVAFRQLVDDILEGVGCEVTDATRHAGLILRSQPDGPWCWPARSADLPWNKSFLAAEDRAARMLVVPALLAYVAPSAADFDELLADPTMVPPTVAVRDLEEFIRGFAQQQEAGHPDPADGDRPVWWHWLQSSEDAPDRKRVARTTTVYPVYDVLQFLHKQGLLAKTAGTSAETSVYRPRRRLLAHYRDLLLDELFAKLQDFASRRPDPTRPDDAAVAAEA